MPWIIIIGFLITPNTTKISRLVFRHTPLVVTFWLQYLEIVQQYSSAMSPKRGKGAPPPK
jgi:hypothetical protein